MRERLLVIDPHPDDESYYFGGALSKFASDGAEIFVLVLTNGEKGKIAIRTGRTVETHPVSDDETQWMVEHRQNDCRRAAEILGVEHIEFAGIPDMGINGNAIPFIRKTINQFDPHVILSFDETGTSYHPTKTDHSAAGIAANIAVRNLLEETFVDFIFQEQYLPHETPFSLRRLITYAPPNVENRLVNWGALVSDPSTLIHVEVTVADLRNQLRASACHRTQEHLTGFFFRKAGVVGLNPIPFYERISIGPRASGTGNIFHGIDSGSTELYCPPFPEPPDHYHSNSAIIFQDIASRSASVASELPVGV